MTSTSTQRTILITGCSTGIGLAAARTMKARGWRVLATARKPADLERLVNQDGVEAIACEMADMASVAACAKEALARSGGRIDALFNNAATGLVGAMEDIPADMLRRHFEVNVIAANELTRLIVPAMRARGAGRIVMCSSVLGLVSGPYRGAYAGTKFALEAISDAMRMELRPAGIHVSLIEPGPIATEFMATTLAGFTSGIDVERSAHKTAYATRLTKMQAGSDNRFRLGPQAVVAKLIHAVEAPRPKARYRVGAPTHAAAIMKRMLPTRLLDWVLERS